MAVLATSPTAMYEVPRTRRAGGFYAPELDILRFLAFSVVFARHVVTGFGIAKARAAEQVVNAAIVAGSASLPSGRWAVLQGFAQCLDFGVCLFFFLSSFLITTLLLLELRTTGTVNVKGFYMRRTLRIWPLYYAFLLGMGLLSLKLGWINIVGTRMWASALLVANWPIVLHGWVGSPIEPLWSVSVEEQFYAVWPQFARFGRKAIIAVSVVLGVVPFITIAVVGQSAHRENTMFWANSLVQCLFFSAGALVAVLYRAKAPTLGNPARVGAFVAGWTCWLIASGLCHVVRTASPGIPQLMCGYCFILAGTVLLFTAFYGWRPKRLPGSLMYLGKISYGLYVFHFFWLELVSRAAERLSHGGQPHTGTSEIILTHGLIALVALAATVASAALSYRLLESPFLRLKSRFTVIASRA